MRDKSAALGTIGFSRVPVLPGTGHQRVGNMSGDIHVEHYHTKSFRIVSACVDKADYYLLTQRGLLKYQQEGLPRPWHYPVPEQPQTSY